MGLPHSGTRLAQSFGRFPFLFVLGVLGTNVVAAYAIARRLMLLAIMPAWGYATASSTLAGQAIGGGDEDEDEAEEYGWQTVRIALANQPAVALGLAIAVWPLAGLIGAEHVALTVEFIYVLVVMIAGFSVARTLKGALRGAGDTTSPSMGRYSATISFACRSLRSRRKYRSPCSASRSSLAWGWGSPPSMRRSWATSIHEPRSIGSGSVQIAEK